MRGGTFCFAGFCLLAACAQAAPKLNRPKVDTARIDAVLGRSGSWVGGVYEVDFLRPNSPVVEDGVQLAAGQVDSFATIYGSDEHAEIMGEICALVSEVTRVVEALRSQGIEITAIHNHFLGETPRLMYIHFMGRGTAVELARAFRAGLAVTATPLGHAAAPRQKTTPEPPWAKSIERILGLHGAYSSDFGFLNLGVPHAGFPPGPMTDFWYGNALLFQSAGGGKVAATGDLAATADEVNPALTALLAHGFQILAVHNHMLFEHPRLFFIHFWKVSSPEDLAAGLKATLAHIHTR